MTAEDNMSSPYKIILHKEKNKFITKHLIAVNKEKRIIIEHLIPLIRKKIIIKHLIAVNKEKRSNYNKTFFLKEL